MKRKKVSVATPEGLYKGYLYMECEDCGRRMWYPARVPTDRHRCECHHKTVLRDVVMMYVTCPKCGIKRTYRTNINAQTISYDCPVCHAPMDIMYNERTGAYETIMDE